MTSEKYEAIKKLLSDYIFGAAEDPETGEEVEASELVTDMIIDILEEKDV